MERLYRNEMTRAFREWLLFPYRLAYLLYCALFWKPKDATGGDKE